MEIKLRTYQTRIVEEIRERFLDGHKRICVTAPTGSGKGTIIAYLSNESKKSFKVLTHRKELKKDLLNRGVNDVQMVETFHRRKVEYPDILVLDECHLTVFDKIIDNAPPETIVIGFSATPIRIGKQKALSEYYTSLVQTVTNEELLAKRYVVPTKCFSHDGIRESDKVAAHDLEGQGRLFESKKTYIGVRKNYMKLAYGKKTIIFTPTIATARQVAEELTSYGLPAYSVDSTTSENERKYLIDKFESSTSDILVNCSLLTTGYDCASIQCVILLRKIGSFILFNQAVGRGVRPYENKDELLVLDFGENVKRFGFWEEEKEYSLEKPVTSKKEGLPPVKICPSCDRMNRPQNDVCVHCGFLLPKPTTTSVEVELTEITKKMRPSIFYYLYRATTIEEAKDIVKEYGYKPGFLYVNKGRLSHLFKNT